MEKRLLFSMTASDFIFQTFCTGGKGGQHRNTKQNGVRCIHPPSGARGEYRDGRDQFLNKREVFRKYVESEVFKAWHRVEIARRLGLFKNIDETVDKSVSPENLRIEIY